MHLAQTASLLLFMPLMPSLVPHVVFLLSLSLVQGALFVLWLLLVLE
jgi:hypothetical protein